jgi:hypothetical protein
MQRDIFEDEPIPLDSKFEMINLFVQALERYAATVAESKEGDKYANMFGTTFGVLYGLLYHLDLTDAQVRKLNLYLVNR